MLVTPLRRWLSHVVHPESSGGNSLHPSPEAPFPYEWEGQALANQELVLSVLDLLVRYPEWVHRRKEQAEIVSEIEMQWSSSVDFTLPDLPAASIPWMEGRTVALVPIDALVKEPLVGFDLRDETGAPVPMLTRRQNAILADAAMAEWATALAGLNSADELPPELRETLRQIVQEPTEVGEELIAAGLPGAGVLQERLLEHAGFMFILGLLSKCFMLIAVLEARPGERRIVKYKYRRQGPWPGPRRTWWGLTRERFGFQPTTLFVGVPALPDCESFHFEATAPPGTQFVQTALVDAAHRDAAGRVDPEWTQGLDDQAGGPHRSHVSTSFTSLVHDPDEAPTPAEYLDPTIVLSVRLDRSVWLRSAMLASWVVGALLLGSWSFVVGWSKASTSSVHCAAVRHAVTQLALACNQTAPDSPLNADPAALMVGLVGLLAVAIVRSGEHAYTAKLASPLRYTALITAGLPLVGGWLLVFPGPESWLLDYGWSGICLAAVIGAAILSRAFKRAGS